MARIRRRIRTVTVQELPLPSTKFVLQLPVLRRSQERPARWLALPNLPPPFNGADWTAFPIGLQKDVEAYLAQLAKPH
jgi:hypothetical protein